MQKSWFMNLYLIIKFYNDVSMYLGKLKRKSKM